MSVVLAACGGAPAASGPGSTAGAAGGGGGGGASFQAFCRDLQANQTVSTALFDLESALPNNPNTTMNMSFRITPADMAGAANDAAALDGEAPRTVTFPGTAMSPLALGADMDGVAQTLQTAAAKMANGDASGYAEVGPGARVAAGTGSGLSTAWSAVSSACTVFGTVGVGAGAGSVPSAAPPASAAASSAPTAQPTASPAGPSSAGTAAVNPCDLLTASDAASLAGVSFGPGGEGPNAVGAPTCTYAMPRPWDILWVSVTQEPDAATAQANWAQEGVSLAQGALGAEPGGGPSFSLTFSDVTVAGADRAAAATTSVAWAAPDGKVSAVVLYALVGSTYVSISDVVGLCSDPNLCGLQAPTVPTVTVLQAQMATMLSRLP